MTNDVDLTLELNRRLSEGEGRYVEFKRLERSASNSGVEYQLVRSIIAFASTYGDQKACFFAGVQQLEEEKPGASVMVSRRHYEFIAPGTPNVALHDLSDDTFKNLLGNYLRGPLNTLPNVTFHKFHTNPPPGSPIPTGRPVSLIIIPQRQKFGEYYTVKTRITPSGSKTLHPGSSFRRAGSEVKTYDALRHRLCLVKEWFHYGAWKEYLPILIVLSLFLLCVFVFAWLVNDRNRPDHSPPVIAQPTLNGLYRIGEKDNGQVFWIWEAEAGKPLAQPVIIEMVTFKTERRYISKQLISKRQFLAFLDARELEMPENVRVKDLRRLAKADGLDEPMTRILNSDAELFCTWSGLELPLSNDLANTPHAVADGYSTWTSDPKLENGNRVFWPSIDRIDNGIEGYVHPKLGVLPVFNGDARRLPDGKEDLLSALLRK